MNIKVEQAVASFLGTGQIDWEKLKPVICFVVLWNRLEARCGNHITWRQLQNKSKRVANSVGFDNSKYLPSIDFFKRRYQGDQNLLDSLFNPHNDEPVVREAVKKLLSNSTLTPQEQLEGTLMIPYRIRNNLFHGNKETVHLYSQTELFENVNDVLCFFYDDM